MAEFQPVSDIMPRNILGLVLTSSTSRSTVTAAESTGRCNLNAVQRLCLIPSSSSVTAMIPEYVNRWRSQPSAILPLAFLQSFAFGLIELPAIYLFRDIEIRKCEASSQLGDDSCDSTAVHRAYTAKFAAYLVTLTITSIVVSGPYGRLSDTRGRKKVMGIAALMNALGDVWFLLCGQ